MPLKKSGLLQAFSSQADSARASSGQELRSRWILHIKDAGLARSRDELPLIVSREELWAVRQCSR